MAATYAVLGSIMMMAYLSVGFSAMSKTVVALTPKSAEELTTAEMEEYQLAEELNDLRNHDFVTLPDTDKSRLRELQILRPNRVFSHIDQNMLIWIVCIIVLTYTVTGGLMAAFISDTVQGLFIIILTFLLLPFSWAKINRIHGSEGLLGAFRTIHEQLPDSFFEIFGSPAAIDFTWYYIAAIGIMSALNTPVQPNTLVATGSARDEYTARFGFVSGLFMKRFCTVFWGILALAAIVLYRDVVHDPDYVWGYATLDLLGPLNMGLVGLMIACLTAALMSTADCLMLTASSLLTRNVYEPLVPNKGEAHYVRAGRILGAIVVIGGALIASQFDTILQLLKFIWEFNVMVAASFWLGMKWRRANRTAAWASIISAMLLFFIIPIGLPIVAPSLRTMPDLLTMTDPPPLTRTYIAREIDVENRHRDIVRWEERDRLGLATSPRPAVLETGMAFEKTYTLEPRSIFWTKGIRKDDNGTLRGSGTLKLELWALDALGVNLTGNPHALNETIRIIIKTTLPFLILVIVSLLTRPDDKRRLDQFFGRMRTKVLPDHEADAREVERTRQDPHRFDHLKLIPDSNWEFEKWDTEDSVGFGVSVVIVLAILGMLTMLVSIGG